MNENHLQDPTLPARIAETVQRQAQEDEAGKRALAEPLPGPLRDVFALQDSITVGKYQVRPFYDIDFEFLSTLRHPLHEMMVVSQTGSLAEEKYFPRGPAAWELAWILTRSPDDVEVAFKQGVNVVKESARAEFSRCQLAALVALSGAAVKQMSRYWSTGTEHGPALNGEGKEKSPPLFGEQPMGSVGSSTNGAV